MKAELKYWVKQVLRLSWESLGVGGGRRELVDSHNTAEQGEEM